MAVILIDGIPTSVEVTESSDTELEEKRSQSMSRRAANATLSGLVFLERLTISEYKAITDAAAAMQQAGDAQLALWIDKLRVNGSIHLSGEDAQAAKSATVAAGLLTQERADIIFS